MHSSLLFLFPSHTPTRYVVLFCFPFLLHACLSDSTFVFLPKCSRTTLLFSLLSLMTPRTHLFGFTMCFSAYWVYNSKNSRAPLQPTTHRRLQIPAIFRRTSRRLAAVELFFLPRYGAMHVAFVLFACIFPSDQVFVSVGASSTPWMAAHGSVRR
jgi:hypothetical protein